MNDQYIYWMCTVCKVPPSVSLILKATTLDATVICLCFIDKVERHRNEQHAQGHTVSKGKAWTDIRVLWLDSIIWAFCSLLPPTRYLAPP